MYIIFNGYLNRLRTEELLKPPDSRREIPTIKQLADAVGVHEVTLHNIVNGKVKQLTLSTVAIVFDELWRRGFRPQVSDLIKYQPPEGMNE